MRSAERPPCRVFCHLGLETLHGFLVMRFGVRCLRQEIGAVLNITCSMAVSSKSGNTKLVADALQRELTDAGVRFAATFDLDGAAAESAHSEGVKGAENVEGAEGSETVENGQSANAAASAPAASTSSASTIATQASEADVVFVGFWCDKGSCSPAVQHFLQGLVGKRVFCSALAVSVKATSISRKFSTGFAHICLPMRSILAARCVKARWVWA